MNEFEVVLMGATLKALARRVTEFAADDDELQTSLRILTDTLNIPGWKVAEGFHMAVISQMLQQMETTAFIMKKIWSEDENLPPGEVDEMFRTLADRNTKAVDFVIENWKKQSYTDGNWASHAADVTWERSKTIDSSQDGAAL